MLSAFLKWSNGSLGATLVISLSVVFMPPIATAISPAAAL